MPDLTLHPKQCFIILVHQRFEKASTKAEESDEANEDESVAVDQVVPCPHPVQPGLGPDCERLVPAIQKMLRRKGCRLRRSGTNIIKHFSLLLI